MTDNVRTIAAGPSGAEGAGVEAEQLLSLLAHRAFPAADPRVGHDLVADLDAGSSRPQRCHSPAISCPIVNGRCTPRDSSEIRRSSPKSKYPSQIWTSLWQTPAASTRSNTSSPLGSGFGYSRVSSGFPHSMICIASMIGSSGCRPFAPPHAFEEGRNESLSHRPLWQRWWYRAAIERG